MKIRFLLYGLACASLLARAAESNRDADEDQQWASYKTRYGKLYDDPVHDGMRQANWRAIKRQVDSWNSEGHSYRQAVNHLADWTTKERSMLTMNSTALSESEEADVVMDDNFCEAYLGELMGSSDLLPREFDWRGTNRVGAVKDQRRCRSSWAFAATGLLEGQFKGDGAPISLSEQQLIDCSTNRRGCCGGYSTNSALNYIVRARGIQSDSAYPYEFRENGYDRKRCSAAATVVNVENSCKYKQPGAEALKTLVVNYGPVAVYMSVPYKFVEHNDSVYDLNDCDGRPINHAVLIVGYGTDESGRDYWIVKNSWGSGWGDGGYFKILRGENKCMIEGRAIIAFV